MKNINFVPLIFLCSVGHFTVAFPLICPVERLYGSVHPSRYISVVGISSAPLCARLPVGIHVSAPWFDCFISVICPSSVQINFWLPSRFLESRIGLLKTLIDSNYLYTRQLVSARSVRERLIETVENRPY